MLVGKIRVLFKAEYTFDFDLRVGRKLGKILLQLRN